MLPTKQPLAKRRRLSSGLSRIDNEKRKQLLISQCDKLEQYWLDESCLDSSQQPQHEHQSGPPAALYAPPSESVASFIEHEPSSAPPSEAEQKESSDIIQQAANAIKSRCRSDKQLTNLQAQLQRERKQARQFKQLYETQLKETDAYKMRLKALAQMIKTGPKPHFEQVKMNKINSMCSHEIQQIKQHVKLMHSKQHKPQTNSISIECNESKCVVNVELQDASQHSWIDEQCLTNKVMKHVIHNKGKEPSKPNILMNGTSMQYNFIIQPFIIHKGRHRIVALATGYQRGIRALIDIPQGIVIGQYVGVEYTKDEFDRIFSHTNEEALRNTYAFDLTLRYPLADGQFKEIEIVIDGHGLKESIMECKKRGRASGVESCPMSGHLLYINDCRADISKDYPTEEDGKHWNIDFVEAVVNGYPAVFLVTRRDISKGQELMSWYGESYDIALKQQTEYDRMLNCITSLVDNSILKGVDLSKDTWIID